LPFFTKGRKKIQANDLYLYSSTPLSASLIPDPGNPFTSSATGDIKTMKLYAIKELQNYAIADWQLTLKDVGKDGLEKLWLLIRYTLN